MKFWCELMISRAQSPEFYNPSRIEVKRANIHKLDQVNYLEDTQNNISSTRTHENIAREWNLWLIVGSLY